MDVATLFRDIAALAPGEAAVRIAGAGVPVFPCVPLAKRPLTEHGFRDATTDVVRVSAWWGRWPDANVAIPTGAVSGFDVVDVDRKPAVGSGFAAFARAHRAGLAGGFVAVVRTPSGGMHAYYPADPDRPQSSWQVARARVDFRGTGGYVLVPPSIVTTISNGDSPYVLTHTGQEPPRPVNAAALREFLDPRPPTRAPRRAGVVRDVDAVRLAAWVGTLVEGERNQGVFWAACRLAEAGTPPVETHAALAPAAEGIGLGPREVASTIRSAYRITTTAPARSTEPAAGFAHEPICRAASRAVTRGALS